MNTTPPTPEAVKAAFAYAGYLDSPISLEILEGDLRQFVLGPMESIDECALRILAAHARAQQAQLDALKDPATVHVNMMRGTIAYTPENLRHVLGLDPHSLEPTRQPNTDPTYDPEHYLLADQIVGHIAGNLALHFQMAGDSFDHSTMKQHMQKRQALAMTREILLDEGERLLKE